MLYTFNAVALIEHIVFSFLFLRILRMHIPTLYFVFDGFTKGVQAALRTLATSLEIIPYVDDWLISFLISKQVMMDTLMEHVKLETELGNVHP